MEPVATITEYLAGKLVEHAEGAVRKHVIERWTRYRANQFFEAFCEAFLDLGVSDDDLAARLDELLCDEVRSQVVFDAYRAVCLSKSRALGPRIIALLTAELVVAGRPASIDDEAIFAAAEELSDSELEEARDAVLQVQAHVARGSTDTVKVVRGSLHERLEQQVTSDTSRSSEHCDAVSIASADLAVSVGVWAAKLQRHGLVATDVKERKWRYDADSERHVDEPGIAREITWFVTYSSTCVRLVEYIKRASVQKH
jgi:hypothetical protein